MEAMGLTAWVSRPDVEMSTSSPASVSASVPVLPEAFPPAASPVLGPTRPEPEPSAGVPEPSVPPEVVSAPAPASISGSTSSSAPVPVPRAAGTTFPPPPLSARRAVAFDRRGAQVVQTNPDGGTVLVAVERGAGTRPGLPPLEGEPAELFALMLRSIGLGRADVSLCALDGPAPGSRADGTPADAEADARASGEPAGPALRELLGGARRTVLMLVHDARDAGPVDVDGDAALRALGVAAFRVPHPALLLERPAAKREAWAALKAVRRRLGELGPGAGTATPGAAR